MILMPVPANRLGLRKRKLGNARTYTTLGYQMPPFYILGDRECIREILDGKVPARVGSDLKSLTNRPLIIRTDWRDIPQEKREMLPRSDELRSGKEAELWLQNEFAVKIAASGLSDANIVLIAHHFVPAVASAWARAEPGVPQVRVEALWGIPEGLYWYAHDTFQVDTKIARISVSDKLPGKPFPFSKRLRYKGSFVAPDSEGAFVHRTTAPPADWSSTIRNENWLSEIAWTTRRVAEGAGQPIALMWFVDTHPDATIHRVLPWFHDSSRLDESPTAAPRSKYRYSSDYRIESEADWERLQADLSAGKSVERIVVEPTEPSLVRNPLFAEKLAELAKDHGIIVELSGGILSHAYYVLTRAGAKVECVDLFGDEADIVEFDKLIRDKIPEGIAERGETAEIVQLKGDALILALQQKIVEEGLEVLDASSGEEIISELADVLEVVNALATALGTSIDDVDDERTDKKDRRGGFEGGAMLIRTATPGTLRPSLPSEAQLLDERGSSRVISDRTSLPSRPNYRRPDLRQTGETALEKVLTVEADFARLMELQKEVFQFALPDSRGHEQTFSVSLELKRNGSTVRAVVRLRKTDPQLPLIE